MLASGRASSTCSTRSAWERCRYRSAAIPPPPDRWSTPCGRSEPATAAICAARPGEVLGVRGPFGSSWPLARAEGRDLVIVAGGIGLAPLRPAVLGALATRERYERIVLLYGGRTPDQLLYADQLERFEADGIDVHVTVDSAGEDWSGHVGLVTTLFDEARLDPERTVAMLCGPEIMMRFAVQALRDRGVDAGDIHVSMERNMKCALTQCGRCVFGPTYVCREGPVMRVFGHRAVLRDAGGLMAARAQASTRRLEVRLLRRLPAEPARLRGRAPGARRPDRDRLLPRGHPGRGRRPVRPVPGRGVDHHRGGRRADP